MKFRKDVNGLRAVAVIPVIIYHFKPEYCPGGYIGVDVFFLISGFIITKVILKEIEKGSFSLIHFYAKRIRRILPALICMICGTLLIGAFFLPPQTYRSLSNQSIAAFLPFSNLYYYLKQGYFQSSEYQYPLLHTWSLAVEEQFYLAYPLLLTIAFRFFSKYIKNFFFIILGFSISIAIYLIDDNNLSFYMPFTRAWEFLIGATLAANIIPEVKSRLSSNVLSYLGVICIILSYIIFSNKDTCPTLYAPISLIGTSLIIHSGNSHKSHIYEALSFKPITFIGIISYSLYLWHWPIFVFYQKYKIEELSFPDLSIVSLLTIIVSYLSWKLIEVSFRNKTSDKKTYLYASITIFTLCLFAFCIRINAGFPQRFPKETLHYLDQTTRDNIYSDALRNREKPYNIDENFIYGSIQKTPQYAIWGDSHADAIVMKVDDIFRKHDKSFKLIAMGGTPPILNYHKQDKKNKFSQAAYNSIIEDKKIKEVIIFCRWSVYIYGKESNLGPAENYSTHNYLSQDTSSIEEQEALFKDRLNKTVLSLIEKGKKVTLLGPVPSVGYKVPELCFYCKQRDLPITHFFTEALYYDQRNSFVISVLKNLSKNKDITYIPIDDIYRRGEKMRIVDKTGMPLYYDDDHPNSIAAQLISEKLERVLFEKQPLITKEKPATRK
jgi:peptidoglycan/LPS O-acetylase OafA/YrhL